jgi:serine O-acetyltransferase
MQQFVLRSYGLDIPVATDVGPGLYIAHPVGTTLSAERIGRNVTIVGAVTLGYREEGGGPKLGDGVFVGTGARILGPVTIGDNANVGANAVVTKDVPAGCTAVGIPARVIEAAHREPQYIRAFGRDESAG